MKLREGFGLVKQAAEDFVRDDALTLGAALAFYTALSIAPLLVLVVWVLSLFGYADQREVLDEIFVVIGPEAGRSLEGILRSANRRPDVGTLAGALGIAMLLFSASGAFGQLQHSLDLIWNVEPKPGQGVRGWLRKRLLSLGLVLTLGFLLAVSLAASAVLSASTDSVGGDRALALRIADVGLPFVLYAVLFGLIYKVLPDVRIAWRDVVVGALATAVLFTFGKSVIGLYLGKTSLASAYGAAGSLVVLLLWVYYSALIVFFGAELTQAWSRLFGRGIQPGANARRRTEPVGTDKPSKVRASAG
ncbi:MAG TPA: YihY/virulence factor BrkB family protein [Planctomycetota bacterium]|nr:YihY/virulence factor BrkB family protein [Planctomycetota bacterium]